MIAFEEFISSCVFIHDDTDSSAGVDWDQHGTNPFLLGPPVCVVDSIEGFGDTYLDYLRNLGALPETIIIPSQDTTDLTENLLSDRVARAKCKYFLDRGLDISVFYSDESKKRLNTLFTDRCCVSRIHPSPESFSLANDKLTIHSLLEDTVVPVPNSLICSSINDLQYFYSQVRSYYPTILIKKHHWNTITISTEKDINRLGAELDFPVIAEVAYSVKSSPVSHNLIWKGKTHHLFLLLQHIQDLKHAGNGIPTNLPPSVCNQIIEYSQMVMERVSNFSGVFGIDFIITTNNELIVVDVNPRFNSSTYPFYFLFKQGVDPENTFAKYGYTKCSIKNFNSIFFDDDFLAYSRDSQEGIVLYSPSFDQSQGLVKKLSYLCVAKEQSRLLKLEKTLLAIVNKR
jgi:predicted ATP-grasp superfamily ATP-dependent carboligase